MKAFMLFQFGLLCAGTNFGLWQQSLSAGCFVVCLGNVAYSFAELMRELWPRPWDGVK